MSEKEGNNEQYLTIISCLSLNFKLIKCVVFMEEYIYIQEIYIDMLYILCYIHTYTHIHHQFQTGYATNVSQKLEILLLHLPPKCLKILTSPEQPKTRFKELMQMMNKGAKKQEAKPISFDRTLETQGAEFKSQLYHFLVEQPEQRTGHLLSLCFLSCTGYQYLSG